MPRLITPFAELELIRQPEQPREPLLAFDAADQYLLEHLHAQPLQAEHRVLVINDSFGALACSLAKHCKVTSWGDSHLGFLALEQNLARNQLPADAVQAVPASATIDGPFDWVLIRVPKVLALLEEQLIQLQPHLKNAGSVIAGAMLKHLPRAAGDLLERYIGPTHASLAQKKARLLISQVCAKPAATSPYPSHYSIPELKHPLINHAGLFSRETLDIGTRAFLPHLPKNLGTARVADLGCGNGVLALVCAQHNPDAHFSLIDESYVAVRSAQENWQAAYPQRPAQIYPADGLATQPPGSLDVVLCNPPFHQQQVVGDFLAWRMFLQARAALVEGGQLWIVGNRHLGYHSKLKRLFRAVDQIAATPKFVILKATR